jgi:flagellar biogenesis protein FliO
MRVVETLPMGGKRQLMLVRCGDEHFLVGGGLESVETIVRVKGGTSVENRDEICL